MTTPSDPSPPATVVDDWRVINDGLYDPGGGSPNRVEARQASRLFRDMVHELQLALWDGAQLYTDRSALYYRMLAEGIAYIQRTFSWERAAQEYARIVS